MTTRDECVMLSFDDEEAGGHHSWVEFTVPGAIPRAGDWVWNHGPGHSHFVVDRVGWSFVQDGSVAARHGHRQPLVRVYVTPLACDDTCKAERSSSETPRSPRSSTTWSASRPGSGPGLLVGLRRSRSGPSSSMRSSR